MPTLRPKATYIQRIADNQPNLMNDTFLRVLTLCMGHNSPPPPNLDVSEANHHLPKIIQYFFYNSNFFVIISLQISIGRYNCFKTLFIYHLFSVMLMLFIFGDTGNKTEKFKMPNLDHFTVFFAYVYNFLEV